MHYQSNVLCFCISLLCILSRCIVSSNPGSVLIVEKNGLNYISSQSYITFTKKIISDGIPDMNGDVPYLLGSIEYKFRDMKITEFKTDSFTTQTSSPNLLSINAAGISQKIEGIFEWKLTFFIHGSIKFIVNTMDGSLSGKIKFVESKDRPFASLVSYSYDINKITIKYESDISWLYKLFSSKLAKLFSENINRDLSNEFANGVMLDLNNVLSSITTDVAVSGSLATNYSLVSNPTVKNNGLKFDLSGKTSWLSDDSFSSLQAPVLPLSGKRNNSLSIFMSPYVVNSAVEGFLNQPKLNSFVVLPEDLPEKLEYILNTSCSSKTCIGNIVEPLGELYPNMSTGFNLSLVSPGLQLSFEPNAAILKVNCVIEFWLNQPDKSRLSIFSVISDMNYLVKFQVIHNKISGKYLYNVTNVSSLKSSSIGNITEAMIPKLIDLLNENIIVSKFDSILSNLQLPLPATDELYLKNPFMTIQKDAILIQADFTLKSNLFAGQKIMRIINGFGSKFPSIKL